MKHFLYCLLFLFTFSMILMLNSCCLSHSYEYVWIQERTCEQEGIRIQACVRCGEERLYSKEIFEPYEHQYEVEREVEATCKESDHIVNKCKNCGYEEKEYTSGQLASHNFLWETVSEATCTQGKVELGTCTVCNETYTKTGYPLSHSKSELIEDTATCISSGTKTYKCNECQGQFKEYSPQMEHERSNWITDREATCVEDGYEYRECTRCHTILEEEIIPSHGGHAYSIYVKTVSATCTENGYKIYKCYRCTSTTTEFYKAAKNHLYEKIDEAVAPTCTQTGLTQGRSCADCGMVKISQIVIDALGHSTIIDEAVAPTCTETGLTEGSHCSRCNEVLVSQNVIDALGHITVIDEALAPTCTETGLTEGSHCSRCETILEKQTIINALGHTVSDWIIDVPATKTTDGHCKKECIICSKLFEEGVMGAGSQDLEYIQNSDGSYSLIGIGNCEDTEIIIPSVHLGNPVVDIAGRAFQGNANMVSIYLPNSIQSIGFAAFENCTLLTSINIPESVTVIGGAAFSNCTSLNNIAIPESVTTIKYNTFEKCTSLMSITLPEGLVHIERYAFLNCTSLKSINIPSTVTEIGVGAFAFAPLFEILLSEDNQTFFMYNGSLYERPNQYSSSYLLLKATTEAVVSQLIPSTPIYIGSYAFAGFEFDYYDAAVDHTNVIGIGESAFESSTIRGFGFTTDDITVPIPDRAFFNSTIENIQILSNISYIGNYAFHNCDVTIHYSGSKDDWNNIEKGEYWVSGKYYLLIYCNDGLLCEYN